MLFVRSDVRCGNDLGIGLREERVGRSVEVRSRCLSFGKTVLLSWGEERDMRGFRRRLSVWRLGSAVSGRMCSREVKALEERSRFVRCWVLSGSETSVRLLEARERVASEGNLAVKFTIWGTRLAASIGGPRGKVMSSQVPRRGCYYFQLLSVLRR